MSIQLSGYFIPLEIVREIVQAAYLSEAPPSIHRLYNIEDIGVSTKPAWTTLASLSCTTRAYREIVLEVWFRTLFIQHPGQLEDGRRLFPKMAQWVCFLHCYLDPNKTTSRFNLSGIQRLNAVRLDHTGPNGVWGPFEYFKNVSPGVVEVHINAGRVSNFGAHPSLFRAVQNFVNLKIIRLRTIDTWCDLCNLQHFMRIGKPFTDLLVYEDGKAGLPLLFRKMLSPLQHLQEVTFITSAFPLMGTPLQDAVVLGSGEDPAYIAWSGECEYCVETVLSDQDFRSRWVAVKTGQIEEMDGSGGRKYRFYPIPSLKRVEWRFVPEDTDPDTDEDTDEDADSSSAQGSEEEV